MDVPRGAWQPPATPRSLIGRAGVGWSYPGAARWPGRGLPRARKPRRAKTLDYPGNGTRLSLETNHICHIAVRSSPLGGSATVRVPVRTVFCDIYNIEQTALDHLGSLALLTNQFIPFKEPVLSYIPLRIPAPVVRDNIITDCY